MSYSRKHDGGSLEVEGATTGGDLGRMQQRIIDTAELTLIGARSALDEAKGTIENLNEGHLLPEDLFWEGISAIDGMTDLLDELITAITGEL